MWFLENETTLIQNVCRVADCIGLFIVWRYRDIGIFPFSFSKLSLIRSRAKTKTSQTSGIPRIARFYSGVPGGIRTPGPQLRRLLLYPAELLGQGFSQ
jgi:hypothetical protein